MITDDVAWLLIEACRHLRRPMLGLRICELGNQESGWTLRVSVKPVLEWLGAEHTSIDLNGRDGALPYDLSKPLPSFMLGQFDLVTNAGTTEHVVADSAFMDQYQAFKSIHDLTIPWAAMLHVVPSEKGAHCGCGYVYTHAFFQALASLCGYRIIDLYDSKSDPNHIACLMIRQGEQRDFPSYAEFLVKVTPEILLTEDHPSKK
jgi:hypothetical protein